MSTDDALAEIRDALGSNDVSIRLPVTFTHGRGVQVYLKTRKVGPIILCGPDQTLGDMLKMLGDMAEDGAS